MERKLGVLIELSMSKRSLSVLNINGDIDTFYLNLKKHYKSFISNAKSMLQNDLIIPVVYGLDDEVNGDIVVFEYYTENEYSLFENTYHIKLDFLFSLYDNYASSLDCVDSFELPDLTVEELRIVDELNESLFDI